MKPILIHHIYFRSSWKFYTSDILEVELLPINMVNGKNLLLVFNIFNYVLKTTVVNNM